MSNDDVAATREEIRIMRHMLGASHCDVAGEDGRCKPIGWRNYGAWNPEDKRIAAMVKKGMLTDPVDGHGLAYSSVTKEWAEALGYVASNHSGDA